jgi:hypothetical protein
MYQNRKEITENELTILSYHRDIRTFFKLSKTQFQGRLVYNKIAYHMPQTTSTLLGVDKLMYTKAV